MSNYKDNQGLLSRCSQKFNPKTNTFTDSTLKESVNCCLEQCKTLNNVCIEKCKENELQYGDETIQDDEYKIKRCHHTCYVLNNKLCTNKCRSISKNIHVLDNDYIKCATSLGCENIKPSLDCIKQKKDSIKQCCINRCDPLENNCEELCDFLEQSILNPIVPHPQFQNDPTEKIIPTSNINYTIIILLPLITVIICLVVSKMYG